MEAIYKEFKNDRGIDLSIEEFQILILAYPIFKVANADDNFDKVESQLMSEILINFFKEIFGNELSKDEQDELAKLYIKDLLFIYSHREKFDLPILKSLTGVSPDIKKSISELLNEIAEISGGLDKKENEVISYLTKNYLS